MTLQLMLEAERQEHADSYPHYLLAASGAVPLWNYRFLAEFQLNMTTEEERVDLNNPWVY